MEASTLDNVKSTWTAALTGTVAETIGMTVAVADFPAPWARSCASSAMEAARATAKSWAFATITPWSICSLQPPASGAETACGCCGPTAR